MSERDAGRARSARIRALQIVLIGLVVISVVQVAMWIAEERRFTRDVLMRLAQADERSAGVANELVASGLDRDRVQKLFPRLELAAGDGRFEVAPVVFEELDEHRRRRITRYLWEGGFTLAVLLAGLGVFAHALRRDAELRRRQENFLAAVSHELKSPLAGMRLSAETLALRQPDAERRDELVKRLLAELGRLERTVFNLLDTNLLDARPMRHDPARVALAPVVSSVLEDYAARVPRDTLRLARDVPEGLEVHADPVAVRTVVTNLVDNAVKATANGRGRHVRVAAASCDGGVLMEVTDDGVGFDAGEAERLFEKFYRSGNEMRRRTQGAGLGLYLVRRFTELSGGRVSAASAGADRGATFRVFWPAAPAAVERREMPVNPGTETPRMERPA